MSNTNRVDEFNEAKNRYLKEVGTVSECCRAEHSTPNKYGQALCMFCQKGCHIDRAITFGDWLDEQKHE